MACPPSKRLRASGPALILDLDPFDEDFTQDDLDEMDVIASQAITTETREEVRVPGGGTMATRGGAMATVGGTMATGGGTMAMGGERMPKGGGTMATRGGAMAKGGGTPSTASRAACSTLTGSWTVESQETHQAELQRKLTLVEEELQLKSGEVRVLRDSLRSAQQEAESHKLRELRVHKEREAEQSQRERELLKKVQSLESQLQFQEAELNDMRSRRPSRSSPLCRNSPKLQSSASPSGGFITKESFSAQVKLANHSTEAVASANHSEVKTPSKIRRHEASREDPFMRVRPPRTPRPGGALLSLLCHRASLCHLLTPSPSSLAGGDVIASGPNPVQGLVLTGLNMLSLDHSRSRGGALLLLPLLHTQLSDVPASSVVPSTAPAVKLHPPDPPRQTQGPEEVVVSLQVLTTLLQHSPEVVESILSGKTLNTADSTSALLQCVLRLCRSPHADVTCAALTTLLMLLQRSPESHKTRWDCVLSEVCACVSADQRLKVVSLCVSVLTSLSDNGTVLDLLCSQEPCVVLRILQFVRSRSDPEATHTDWVQLDFKVIRFLSRILAQSSERPTNIHCQCNSELVQCVVLVLHRLWLDLRSPQAPPTPAQAPPTSSHLKAHVHASLQETVLLFHWLLQNHRSFTESLRGVFHLYDQVIPGLRPKPGLKPGLEAGLNQDCSQDYSQELALDEICRCEPDDDMDTGS
ncbi:unnamed protein product [Knipowitschia caucasica]|uniref:ATR-interacting protein n=1 Tax=Knipowitschia caucasica TaxID=637954 RepID=A0AAV2MHU2_KNICA